MTQPYTWQNIRIGGGGFVTGLEFHPTERDLAYARTDVGDAYRWNGRRRRWTPLLDWLGATDWNLTGVESVAIDPGDPDRLLLAVGTYRRVGNGAILVSADRGRSFRRSDLPCPMGANEAGRGNGERLAVDPVTLLASRDGARTFEPRRSNLPRGPVVLAVTPGAAGDLWLAAHTAGLLHSSDGGMTFARVESVEEAHSLGFGRGAQDRHNPALYLHGKVAGILGIFRSNDAGSSFARLNDDAHQFGSIRHLTGDPRVWGRVYFATGGRGILRGDPAISVTESARAC